MILAWSFVFCVLSIWCETLVLTDSEIDSGLVQDEEVLDTIDSTADGVFELEKA